jgi:hypothetical protein
MKFPDRNSESPHMAHTSTLGNLRCPTCGFTQPPKKGGVIIRLRAGGHHLIRTRILGRCSVCNQMKFLIADGEENPGTPTTLAASNAADREVTLVELAAYVSENTMTIDTAEAIAQATCPEPRKRHIAALVAEGVLSPQDALRLLAI